MSPYIKTQDRVEIDMGRQPTSAGELNYFITDAMLRYLSQKVFSTPGQFKPCYADYNEVIGVLECAKQELYRRRIAPYEDEKIISNGDIYE